MVVLELRYAGNDHADSWRGVCVLGWSIGTYLLVFIHVKNMTKYRIQRYVQTRNLSQTCTHLNYKHPLTLQDIPLQWNIWTQNDRAPADNEWEKTSLSMTSLKLNTHVQQTYNDTKIAHAMADMCRHDKHSGHSENACRKRSKDRVSVHMSPHNCRWCSEPQPAASVNQLMWGWGWLFRLRKSWHALPAGP